jgi:phage-related protein
MNLQQYLTPQNVTLAAGITGGVIALALIGLALWNRRTLSKGASHLWQSIFSQGGLFYVGMGLFMLASVVEAGPVLNKIAMHGTLWGYGGHMLVFAFDMISAVSLRARLNARRVFDTRGMKLQMWGICLPAAVSVSANLAGALQGFNQSDFNHLFIFAWLLPLIGAVFPSMIIVLSLAADHLLDTTAVNVKIDPEDFRKQEKKRVEILKVRLETEQELLKEESKIAAIRSERDQTRDKKPTHEWFFTRWLRPHVTPPMATIKAEIEQAVNEARKSQEQQAHEFAGALSTVQQALATITDQLQQVASFKSQLEQVAGAVEDQRQQFTTFRSQAEAITSSVEQLTTSLETLKVKHTPRQHDGSNDGSGRAKVVNLHPLATSLQTTDKMNLGRKERAFIFIAEYQRRNEGAEPTLPEIMEAVGCAQGSASNYRSDYRKMYEAQRGELAAVAGATNGHHPM